MAKTKTFKPHIVHHRHSFRLLPVHHTSYSLSLFMLLLVGIFSLGWTSYVNGAPSNYQVNAVVQADPLTSPATISAPTNQSRVTEQNVSVSGACPPFSYIKLNRNGVFAGTAMCSNGGWTLDVALSPGQNLLQAQAYNNSNNPGPTATGVTVFYDLPKQPSTPDAVEPDSEAAKQAIIFEAIAEGRTTPLVLSGGFSFLGVIAGNEVTQSFTINGGSKPYAVRIDWGDGTSDLISRPEPGEFQTKHTYVNPGTNARNTYIVRLNASDSFGQETYLQTVVIVTLPSAGTTSGATSSGDGGAAAQTIQPTGTTSLDTFVKVATPVYATSMVALGSFWLGQHRELEILRQQIHKSTRRVGKL